MRIHILKILKILSLASILLCLTELYTYTRKNKQILPKRANESGSNFQVYLERIGLYRSYFQKHGEKIKGKTVTMVYNKGQNDLRNSQQSTAHLRNKSSSDKLRNYQDQIQSNNGKFDLNPSKHKSYVFWCQIGRLGNFMSEFAGTYCLALKTGRIHTIEKNNEFKNHFPNIKSVEQDYLNLRNIKTNDSLLLLKAKDQLVYDENMIQTAHNHTGNIAVFSFFYARKYFEGCWKEIKSAFKFSQEIQGQVLEIMNKFSNQYANENKIYRENLTYIGVHVRRGDRSYGFKDYQCSSYLQKAFKHYNSIYKWPIYFLASDNITWCQNHIKYTLDKGNVYVSKAQDYFQDFVMLSSCNHSIMTIGTFGFWSGILHGGNVVYYDGFPSYSTKTQRLTHFLPHWVGYTE